MSEAETAGTVVTLDDFLVSALHEIDVTMADLAAVEGRLSASRCSVRVRLAALRAASSPRMATLQQEWEDMRTDTSLPADQFVHNLRVRLDS